MPTVPAMTAGARTPEELETMLEDAFVMRDAGEVSRLFERTAVVSLGERCPAVRGRAEIARAATAMWSREEPFLAAPLCVLQRGGMALVAGESSTSLARHSGQAGWRYAIALLHSQPQYRRSRR
jgi:hypothetical protein